MGLESRERAALVKACAVLGGIEERSIRTVARRLGGRLGGSSGSVFRSGTRAGTSEATKPIGGKGRGGRDALFYPGVGDKRVDHEITASSI